MKAVGCPLKDRSWAKPNGGELGIPWDVLSAAMLTEMLLLKVFEIHEVGIYHGGKSEIVLESRIMLIRQYRNN